MVIQAAIAGQGVALLNPLFCAHAIDEGRLVPAVQDIVVADDEGYWFVHSPDRTFAHHQCIPHMDRSRN
jgi:DNA-binding transcriptional LysR family regulator